MRKSDDLLQRLEQKLPAGARVKDFVNLIREIASNSGTPVQTPTNNTNNTNATVVVPDSDASAFKPGATVTYYDVSNDVLHSEKKSILTIGQPGSGGGTGKTLITLSGLWTTAPPVEGDLLVIIVTDAYLRNRLDSLLGSITSSTELLAVAKAVCQ